MSDTAVTPTDGADGASSEAVAGFEIRRRGRHFALYERGALLALVCYKVGAIAVKTRIEALEQELATLQERTPQSVDSSNQMHATGEPPRSR